MNKNSPAASYGLGYQLIHDLVLMRAGASIERRCRELGNAFRLSFVGEILPPLGSNLSYTCFRSTELTIVNIHGVIGSAQATAFNRGYTDNPNSSLGYIANRFAEDNAKVIVAQSKASGANADMPIIAAGHSAGGACAQLVAGFWQSPSANGQQRYVSFGAPRAGGRRLYDFIGQVDGAYYMNRYDPVPNCPFHEGEGDIARFLATADVRSACDAYTQPGFGVELDVDARPVVRNEPRIDSGSTELSLLSFLLSNSSLATYFHSPETYEYRMRNLSDAANDTGNTEPRLVPNPPHRARDAEPVLIQPLPARVIIDNAENAFQLATASTRERPPYIAKKIGDIWYVYSGELMLCVARGKVNAKRLARRMNSALGAWNSTRFGDQNAFKQASGDNFRGEA